MHLFLFSSSLLKGQQRKYFNHLEDWLPLGEQCILFTSFGVAQLSQWFSMGGLHIMQCVRFIKPLTQTRTIEVYVNGKFYSRLFWGFFFV